MQLTNNTQTEEGVHTHRYFTFNKKHGPTGQVFNCEDHVSSISQRGISNAHLVLAAIVNHLYVAIGNHNLAIDGPGRLIVNIVREVTFKSAVFTFQDRCCLQTLNNSDV